MLDLFDNNLEYSTLCLRGDPNVTITDIFGWDGVERVGVDYERGKQGYFCIVYRDGRINKDVYSENDVILISDYKGLQMTQKDKANLSNLIKQHKRTFNIKG